MIRRGILKKALKFVILSNLYFVLLLIYIYSSEKRNNKVGLETFDVFCPRVGWRKYFTFFWEQKYEELQFALTYNAPSSFLLGISPQSCTETDFEMKTSNFVLFLLISVV